MPKVISWTQEDWSKEMTDRLSKASAYRQQFETQWQANFNIVFSDISFNDNQFNISFESMSDLNMDDMAGPDSEIGINEIFRYVRFWHSQMSANPPTVTTRPTSADPKDRRAADAADRIARYLRKQLDIGEIADQRNLNALVLGTGYSKVLWEATAGDVDDFDEETDEITMTGAHSAYAPSVENVWLDPLARSKKQVRWTIERLKMTPEEAKFRWSDYATEIDEHVERLGNNSPYNMFGTKPTSTPEEVSIFEYREKAAPINGMKGRMAFFLEDGLVLEYGINKHYKHDLPIKILTYIDVPDQVYGKSVVEYALRLQVMLNKFDSSTLEAIQNHNVVRMAINEATKIEDEGISNENIDIIKWSGAQPPTFMPAAQLMPDGWRIRDTWVRGIQELFGINDSMLGIQRREQSAVSQQTSVESGTMLHRRLFKKYTDVTEAEYRDLLGLVQQHWDIPRQVQVLGDEKAFLAIDYSSADVASGFDFSVSYGTSLPLDPNMAREQLMLMMPLLKESGMSMTKILSMFKLSELETLLDRNELAADRQREIFEEMIAKAADGEAEYIPPRQLQEHQAMLEYAYDYVMSSEFFHSLPDDTKALIEQHINERIQMAAQAAAPAAGAPPAPAPAGPANMMGGLGLAPPPPGPPIV